MTVAGVRIGAALVLGLLACWSLSSLPAAAQSEDIFTVGGIAVDVTADSAAEARDRALVEGQRAAFEALLERLVPAEELARLPRLSDTEITDMVADFEVGSERTSAVRYIGELTFRFRAEPVRAFLERNRVAHVPTRSEPVLVVPLYALDGRALLWEEDNIWHSAWAARPSEGTLVPLLVPIGDLDDIAVLDAEQARDGDRAALARLAERYGSRTVLVAEARPGGGSPEAPARLDLAVRRYGPAGLEASYDERLEAGADPLTLYADAIERIAAREEAAWRQQNLVSVGGAEQRMDVTVPVQDLAGWVDLQRRLRQAPGVRGTELVWLTRQEARLSLTFAGDETQLARALAQQGLSLAPGAAGWVIAPAAGGSAATSAGN